MVSEQEKSKDGASFIQVLKETLFLWLSSTSVHGIPKVMKSDQNIILRIFWLVSFMCSVVLCGYLVYTVIATYLSFSVATSIQEVSERPAEFPLIIFCNLNSINNKKGYDLADTINLNTEISEAADIDKQVADVKQNILKITNDTEKFTYGLQMNEMLISCQYNYADCNWTDFEPFYDLTYGNCYKFNNGKDFYGNATAIKTATVNGYQYGLSLELFFGVQKEADYLAYSSGGFFYIGNRSNYPLLSDFGFFLPTGHVNQVKVNREVTSNLPAPYSQCHSDITSPDSFDSDLYRLTFNFSSSYQQNFCLALCYQHVLLKNCNCQSTGVITISDNSTWCADSNPDCMEKYFDISDDQTFLNENCFPYCPKECLTVEYDITVTGSSYPSPFYAKWLATESPVQSYYGGIYDSYQDVAGSVMMVNIFYDKLSYTYYSDAPLLTFVGLLSNFGGYMGLFIGMSVLSMLEVFELWFIFAVQLCHQLKRKTPKVSQTKTRLEDKKAPPFSEQGRIEAVDSDV